MKVYVAAPWVRKDDAKRFADKLRAVGIIVTSRWFTHEGSTNDSAGVESPIEHIRMQAHQDIQDVRAADALVVLNLQKSEGKAVETGIALAADIPIVSVGPRSNIFQSLAIEVVSDEEAIDWLVTQKRLLAARYQ